MRQYVPSRDVHLRRTAENLSAAIGNVQRTSPELFDRLVQLLRGLADHDIETLAVTKSELGDVMLALDEGELGLTPAREMSDGILRFLAITTSLLTGGRGLDLGSSSAGSARDGAERALMLVVEELENGLHPSQASEVLQLVRQASAENDTQVLITTHSPALLSALGSADHEGVVVCWRDRRSGTSRIDQAHRTRWVSGGHGGRTAGRCDHAGAPGSTRASGPRLHGVRPSSGDRVRRGSQG